MEIKTDKYNITYDLANATVTCKGSLLLNGAKEYEPILQLLNQAAEQQQPNSLTIDIRELKFLNSSGINMMTKFVINVSDIKSLELNLIVIAYKKIVWQEKLSKNLRRLMPTLLVKLE
ncbi:MAG: hypothetical protein DRQ49_16115 [Gammaproteobacteria bacterium]|nr:MAG: hypothetical protein DRQ49_16115 [Gammaproteobacteria bacterium]RKZ43320.1 MAG: hypothetical protein DRQ41_05595 [Gammaproteobacteria bacterium]RKZ75831.1 MAG: hypothetical protein DRQ57_05975 [Gammaproteobacteria bacterium]